MCLINIDINVHPSQVSSPFFIVFLFIFLSALSKHLQEVLSTGGSIQTWRNEQRLWMMKSVTNLGYGSLEAIMNHLGLRRASFLPTNKVSNEEQVEIYQMGKLDFQTSPMFLVPMLFVIILNMACLVGGIVKTVFAGNLDKTLVQILLSVYILLINHAIIEGMFIRKDKGRISSSVSLISFLFFMIFLFLSFFVLM